MYLLISSNRISAAKRKMIFGDCKQDTLASQVFPSLRKKRDFFISLFNGPDNIFHGRVGVRIKAFRHLVLSFSLLLLQKTGTVNARRVLLRLLF